MPFLLHELGHVKDYENKINFDRDTKTADFIEAEVYANLFALDESFRRGYYLAGESFLDSMTAHQNTEDHRGEVCRRLLARFQKPAYRPWTDYKLTASGKGN